MAPQSTWSSLTRNADTADELWETFHENSKSSMFEQTKSDGYVAARMSEMAASLDYAECPETLLPAIRSPLDLPLDLAVAGRQTSRSLDPKVLPLEDVAALLHCAYGVTHDQRDVFPRSFRAVPSGGALYPLEIYFHTVLVDGLAAGLYHYNPERNAVRLIRSGDGSRAIAEGLVQDKLPFDSSMIVFITVLPKRSTYKYGDRGYRFALIEAGHVGQNINLAAVALGLGTINLGGFFDRRIDRFLNFNGVDQSTLYLVAIGGKNREPEGQIGL